MKSAPHQVRKATIEKAQLKTLFRRVAEVIEAETRQLRRNPAAALAESNTRKNRCLYELNLVSRALSQGDLDDELRTELRALRGKVADNSAALKAAMEATKEVIGILGTAITNAESDGTYPSASRLPLGYG